MRATLNHDAVGRDALAGLYAKHRAGLQGVDGDEALVAVDDQPRLVGHQAVEEGEGAGGLVLGGALDGLAEEDEGDDRADRVVIGALAGRAVAVAVRMPIASRVSMRSAPWRTPAHATGGSGRRTRRPRVS